MNGIQRSTLADLVAREPEGQAVLVAEVLADTTHIDVILASSLQRHRVLQIGRVVNERTTRSSSDSLLSFLDADGLLSLNPNALRVAAQRADTHTHSRALGIGMHNLARLVIHLHLFLRVAVGLEDVNLRNDVVSQLVGKLLDGLYLTLFYHLLILLLQFGHSSGTSTRSALVRRNVDALDVRDFLQWLKHHDHHNGGAVGVGNDATRTVQRILGIALGHHQGYIVVHAESAGVVNHHSTILRDGLGKLLRRAGTSRGEGNVDILEIVVMLEQLHSQLLTAEGVFRAC